MKRQIEKSIVNFILPSEENTIVDWRGFLVGNQKREVEITEERIETIKENMDLPPEGLQILTGGLPVLTIKLIKEVIEENLRERQSPWPRGR